MEGEEGGDEEKKNDANVDDGVPDLKLSSKVSLHSDKKITEPLLPGDEDEGPNIMPSQNSHR